MVKKLKTCLIYLQLLLNYFFDNISLKNWLVFSVLKKLNSETSCWKLFAKVSRPSLC